MRARVVVVEDRVVVLTGFRHPDRAHLTHSDAVTETCAAELEAVLAAHDLEQRRAKSTERPADPQVARDLARTLVALHREHLDAPRDTAPFGLQAGDVADRRQLGGDQLV